MSKRRLPIGIQTFRKIRQEDCYYVDKTAYIRRLPRRGYALLSVETLCQRHIRSLDLDGMESSDELLSTFDVDDIATEALLFQTGYLTIIDAKDRGGRWVYRLGYPNREVRQSLNESLLRYLVQDATRQTANSGQLYDRIGSQRL